MDRWNSADRLIRQAKIAYRLWLPLHPSDEKALQLKYDLWIAKKGYDRAPCHDVGRARAIIKKNEGEPNAE